MRASALVLALLTAAPLPAMAGVLDLLDQGIDGCFNTVGDSGEATANYLADQDWSGDADTEMGLGWLYPAGQEDPFITVAVDGSFCQVESTSVDSSTASERLRAYLEAAGQEYQIDKDEMGCTKLDLGDGYAVTITSGGNDPICGSDENSALRFTYE